MDGQAPKSDRAASAKPSAAPTPGQTGDMQEYWIDAWQRSILSLDVLRRRGNNYLERNARTAPNVLTFAVEPVLDGRTLARIESSQERMKVATLSSVGLV